MNVYVLFCICLGYWPELDLTNSHKDSRAVWWVVGWDVPLCPTTDPVFMFRLKKPPKEKRKKLRESNSLFYLQVLNTIVLKKKT